MSKLQHRILLILMSVLVPQLVSGGWWRTYGGPSGETGQWLEITDDGSYMICGGTLREGGARGFLLKVGPDGDSLWMNMYMVSFDCQFYSMTKTRDSCYVLTGYARGFDVAGDMCLLKLNSYGDSLWAKHYRRDGDDRGYSIQETSDGGFAVAGITEPLDDHNDDLWVLKFDSLGDTLWTRKLVTTPGGKNNLMCVKQTPDGGYIISGSTGKNEPPKGFEIWLVKTDSLGLVGIEEFDNPPSIEASTVVGRGVTFSYSNLDSGFHAVVYSSSGQRVDEIHSDSASGTVTWGQGHRPGVYFIKELSGTVPVRKVVLIY